MFDVVTFGSATLDTFLKLGKEDYKIIKENKFPKGEAISFPLGSKVKVNNIISATGGGGTNTAATFVRQGFNTTFCGRVGKDLAGEKILKELEDLNINTDFISTTDKKPTNNSVILTAQDLDRTILVYRGASELFCENDIPWKDLKNQLSKNQEKWFYLAPFSGKFCRVAKDLIDFAKKNEIKVSFNPSKTQINLPKSVIEGIIKKVDILILNQEEASELTNKSYKEEVKIFQKINKICSGIVIVTKGGEGVVVSDGEYFWSANSPEVKVVDRTGAGDSFGSGFVAEFIKSGGNIKEAIQAGVANAVSCIGKWGAKNGLLKKDEKFKRVKVRKESCSQSKFCK